MKKPAAVNLPASVRQRLLNLSHQRQEDFNLVLSLYAIERFLYRLSQSSYADQFVLKGAVLFSIWTGKLHRPTRDLDLLGFGDLSGGKLNEVFQAICRQDAPPDGMIFHADSIRVNQILERQEYGGQRLQMKATFARRATPVPTSTPITLSGRFAQNSQKIAQWKAFLSRSRLDGGDESFEQVVANLEMFLRPPINSVFAETSFAASWPPSGPWTPYPSVP